MNVDIENLRECFEIDVVTGKLRWRDRPDSHFASARIANTWRTRFAGKDAGSVNSHGYLQVCVKYQMLKSHQVVFALVHDRWPTGPIDHIDGDRLNNSPSNLREVTVEINSRNRKMPNTNTSGHVGVNYLASLGLWIARIGDKGRSVTLGNFQTKIEAVAARKIAEAELGYSETHGRKI